MKRFLNKHALKQKKTLEFELSKSRETFQFNPPISIEGSLMTRLRSLEVYNSIFNITERHNEFELYTDNSDEISFEELKDLLEEFLCISDVTSYHLQHEKIGPRFIEA